MIYSACTPNCQNYHHQRAAAFEFFKGFVLEYL